MLTQSSYNDNSSRVRNRHWIRVTSNSTNIGVVKAKRHLSLHTCSCLARTDRDPSDTCSAYTGSSSRECQYRRRRGPDSRMEAGPLGFHAVYSNQSNILVTSHWERKSSKSYSTKALSLCYHGCMRPYHFKALLSPNGINREFAMLDLPHSPGLAFSRW